MAEIHGSCDERFSAVSSALAENIDAGEETGASLVVDLDGEIALCGSDVGVGLVF